MTAPEIVYTQTPNLVLKEQKIPREKCPNPLLTAIALKIEEECVSVYRPAMEHIALKGKANGDGLEKVKLESRKFDSRNYSQYKKVIRLQALMVQGLRVDSNFPDKNILVVQGIQAESTDENRPTGKLWRDCDEFVAQTSSEQQPFEIFRLSTAFDSRRCD